MNELSAFERRLAAGLEAYAGPRQDRRRRYDRASGGNSIAAPAVDRRSASQSAVAPAPRLAWRPIAVAALVAVLALALAAGAVFVGGQQHPLPAVVAPAANGLIAYGSDGDILVGDAVTGLTRAIVTGPAVDSNPLFSPDGSRIAFVRGEWETADASIIVVRADGSDERVIVPSRFPGRGLGAFAWTPDSASILVDHDVGMGPTGGFLSIFDASGEAASRLLTPPLPAWPGGQHPQTRGGVAPMFRPPTGDRILSYEWNTGTLFVMDPDGTDVSELLGPSRTHTQFRVIESPAWSPDGSIVVFAAADEANRVAVSGRTGGSSS